MGHKFKLSDRVTIKARFAHMKDGSTYQVVRLLPESANGDHHYRVKGDDGIERAVSEAEIERTRRAPPT